MTEEEKSEGSVKDKLSSGIGSIGEKAKSTAKKGIKSVEEKTKDVASKGMKKVGDKATKMVNDAIEGSMETSDQQDYDGGKSGSNMNFGQMAARSGKNIDNQVRTWQGWFWSTIAYGFLIILSFTISSTDSRFSLLPIVLLIGFPFYLYYAIINSIPEIKLGNRVIFSRKNLSMKQQLSFTRQVARTFSREMIKNSPMGAFFIFAFLLLLLYTLISPFIGA